MDKRPTTTDNETMMVCKQVRYTGRVQGVGFRYTAQHLATVFKVAGYVRNLPSGDVELVAEGTAEEVNAFLAAISHHMAGYIEQSFVQDAPPGGYKGFQIRH
jgi:acylphosphatase